MSDLKTAKEVQNVIKQKVSQSKYFSGIEIAALKKGDTYTEDLCVRVLVNENNITHKELGIPNSLNNIPIIIKTSIIESL